MLEPNQTEPQSKPGPLVGYPDPLLSLPLRLRKLRDQKSLTLSWHSFSGWGREHVASSLAYKGGQYPIHGCLQLISTQITQDVERAGSCAGDMDVAGLNSKCVLRDNSRNVFSESYYCLLYKRTSKERRKGNPPTPSTLSLYTFLLPPSNHSSCSDVPSESYPMILHTTPLFLIITTTPSLLTSQHLKPLPYLTKLYRHHLAASSASFNVSAFP